MSDMGNDKPYAVPFSRRAAVRDVVVGGFDSVVAKWERHMRKAYRWLLLLVFVAVNGFVIAWAWRSLKAPEPTAAPVETTDERRRAVSEHWGRTDKLAYDLIAQWNRAAVVKLDSDQLPAAVEWIELCRDPRGR